MSNTLPLIVDLDGTLLKSDLLLESAVVFAQTRPLSILKPFFWLTQGKAHLKEQLANQAPIDASDLPYNPDVLEFITTERNKGRTIILATASHLSYATQIAEHLQLFDQVLATDGATNLSAVNKRNRLVAEFGDGGFDYMGNSSDDLVVWQAARSAYVVTPDRGVEARARAHGNVAQVFHQQGSTFKAWAKGLRFHQWLKNFLIFVPLLASHQISWPMLLQGLLAFVFFGLCASSVYILNDLLDLADDRHHPNKRHRPFASGRLSIQSGLLAFPLLLLASFVGAIYFLPWRFAVVLVVYYALTLLYSLVLKRLMTVDVITLALLYTLRIIAGIFAFDVVLTFWMLLFSIFIFLSLALIKRYAELRDARVRGKTSKTRGRGYYPDDLEMISSLGASSGYLSVMVLALYTQDPNTVALYSKPHFIWLACPLLLFWITRMWLLTHRGQMHEDPVTFAAKDKVSLAVGVLFCLFFWAAT